MIDLEVQALVYTREGLMSDVGRSLLMAGFSLQHQRLETDRNGILLTMQVRGPERKRKALASALDDNERIVSYQLAPFDGTTRPHFAAARSFDYTPPPPEHEAPAAPAPATAPVAKATAVPVASTPATVVPTPAAPVSPPVAAPPVIDDEPIFIAPTVRPSASPAPVETPFEEIAPLDADEARIAQLLPRMQATYPQLLSAVQELDSSVAPGAREPSLQQAGHALGVWLARERGLNLSTLPLASAMEQALPLLRALTDTDFANGQLQFRHSALCDHANHSGCVFYAGALEGLLGKPELSQFNVCCRSYGAEICIWALAD